MSAQIGNHLNLSRLLLIAVCALSMAACSTTSRHLNFEVDANSAKVWPAQPDQARYRYVGTLLGEQNFDTKSESTWSKFFRWIVGLGFDTKDSPLELLRPNSGTVDNEGRVLVTDVARHGILVFDVEKGDIFEWQMASGDNGFKTPVGIVTGPEGAYFVTDADLKWVVKLDHDGNPMSTFGEEVLKRPTGIARDATRGRLYVADTQEHNIKVFDDNGFLLNIIGQRGTDSGQFNAPTHVTFVNDRLYVTDTFNTRIQILDTQSDTTIGFGQRGRYVGDLVRPKGVAVDSDENIYVVESYHDYLLVYDKSGRYLLPLGGTGQDIGQFYLPSGVWVDKNDRIYVADMFNGRVVVFQYLAGHVSGKLTDTIGTTNITDTTKTGANKSSAKDASQKR